MNFPEIFTVWVIRNNVPFLVGVKSSKADAIDFGNKTVSTKEFEIRVYVNKEVSAQTAAIPVVKAEVIQPELDLSKLSTIRVNDD